MTLSGASVGRQETADYASAVTLHFGLPKCRTHHRIFVRRWLRRSFGQHADILVCRRTHEKWVKCTLQGVRSRITSGTDKTRTAWFVQNAPQKCSYNVGRLHSRVASTKCSLHATWCSYCMSMRGAKESELAATCHLARTPHGWDRHVLSRCWEVAGKSWSVATYVAFVRYGSPCICRSASSHSSVHLIYGYYETLPLFHMHCQHFLFSFIF
jgi:hypothetical protein